MAAEGEYDVAMNSLEAMATDHPVSYHRVLHDLYNAVWCVNFCPPNFGDT